MKKILIFLVIAINSISLAWADLQDGIDAYADQNFEKAINELTPLANKGDSQAQYYLGKIYDYWNSDFYDEELSDEWLEKAALQGNIDAQFSLGSKSALRFQFLKYQIDENQQRLADEQRLVAINWLTKASNQGDIPSSHYLAGLYSHWVSYLGSNYDDICSIIDSQWMYKSESNDYLKAKKLFESTALDNYAPSQYALAALYYYGIGVEQDSFEAFKWFSKFVNTVNKSPYRIPKNRLSPQSGNEDWINVDLYKRAQNILMELSWINDRKLKSININKIESTKDLSDLDLSNSNLSEIYLRERYIGGTNFSGSNLNRANLSKTMLHKVKLNGASLERANLMYADLSGSNFTNASLRKSDLRVAGFEKAKLINADLTQADIYKTNFSEANLNGANFRETKIVSSKFKRASLCAANLSNLYIDNAEMYLADLRGANLSKSRITYSDFNLANFNGANLTKTKFSSDVDLEGADFIGADLSNAEIKNVDLTDANFASSNLYYTNFKNSNLTDTFFLETDLSYTNLKNVNLTRAKFKKANLYYTDLTGANLSDAVFEDSKFCKTIMPDGIVNNSGCYEKASTDPYDNER